MKKRRNIIENSNLKTAEDVFKSFDDMFKRLKIREQVTAMIDRLKNQYGYDYYSAMFSHEMNNRTRNGTSSDTFLAYTVTDQTKKSRSYTTKFKTHGMSIIINFKGAKSSMSFTKDLNFTDQNKDSAFGMSASTTNNGNVLDLFLKNKNAGVQEFIAGIEVLIANSFQKNLVEVEKRLNAVYAQVQKAAADKKAEEEKQDQERLDDFQSRKITGNSLKESATLAEKIADTKQKLLDIERLVSDKALDQLQDKMSMNEWGGTYCHARNDDDSSECVGFSNERAAQDWINRRKARYNEDWTFGMGGCNAGG